MATTKHTKDTKGESYFMPFQARWIRDESRLKIVEKSRQIGFSYCDSYDSVRKVAPRNAKLPVWVSSRDDTQAKQYLQYCKRWAKVLNYAADDLGEVLIDAEKNLTAYMLRFANELTIGCVSSNPDAIAGKSGHIKIDEFALRKMEFQREAYAIGKPATQWGGQFTVISTHRGVGSLFNTIIRDIKERGNPMGWSLHTVPIQTAVAEGLVEKINAASGGNESREEFLARIHRECIDEEQWLQEYCCQPADESTAFITYEMITAAETEGCHRDYAYLHDCPNPLYIGWDVARKGDLSVIDVEELAGDVLWERMRIEMKGKKYAEQRWEFERLLGLRAVRRACIDATGLGNQMAEEMVAKWGYRAEAVTFTAQVKQDLAGPLRMAHEDRKIRYPREEALRADLRGVKKETTAAGNIRFVGEAADSHCDRFWAKALAVHATGKRAEFSSVLI
jgi:phage FluMu gp28-like protein